MRSSDIGERLSAEVFLSALSPVRGRIPQDFSILRREPNNAGSHPSEIIHCRLGNQHLSIFRKSLLRQRYTSFGHRSGLGYEIDVYRHVLAQTEQTVPAFYGAVSPPSPESCLLIENLDRATPLDLSADPYAIVQAAAWAGKFHAENEAPTRDGFPAFLKRYDRDYYLGWIRRTLEFSAPLHSAYPWIDVVCRGAEETVVLLLEGALTVIHGEFYPKNVLIEDDVVYPIDWESAAIAPGEIDFAFLIAGWPTEIAELCYKAYCHERWSAFPNSSKWFDLALLYSSIRVLGDRAEWTQHDVTRPWFEQLHTAAEKLGLI